MRAKKLMKQIYELMSPVYCRLSERVERCSEEVMEGLPPQQCEELRCSVRDQLGQWRALLQAIAARRTR